MPSTLRMTCIFLHSFLHSHFFHDGTVQEDAPIASTRARIQKLKEREQQKRVSCEWDVREKDPQCRSAQTLSLNRSVRLVLLRSLIARKLPVIYTTMIEWKNEKVLSQIRNGHLHPIEKWLMRMQS